MRRKGSALSSASSTSHADLDEFEVLRDGGISDMRDRDAAFFRDLGTEEPRKGTEDGPLSCDALALEELANAAMMVENGELSTSAGLAKPLLCQR